MDNRISEFIKTLEENLQGLSVEETKEALLYYNEYLNDAADSGKDIDEVIKQLGNPQEIAAMLKAEESFSRAQKKPGIRNFNNAMKNAFQGVTSPFGFFVRGLFLFIVYSFLIVFMGGALVFLLGAIAGLLGLLYEMFKIPSQFLMERLGTLGIALFISSLLFIISLVLFRFGQWLIRLAARTVRKMMRNKVSKEAYEPKPEGSRKNRNKLIVGISLCVLVIGLILSFASGLPFKLYNIFYSVKPADTKIQVYEYNTGDVKSIQIKTAHSCIRVVNDDAKADKIVITYEQPDWLSGQSSIVDGKVVFNETSNGRLPLFELVSLHESRTEATLYLPKDFTAEKIKIESKGGFVSIMDVSQDVNAITYTGMITLNVSESDVPYNLTARTEMGSLDVRKVYPEGKDSREISINQQNAARTFDLYSNRGKITVK